MSTSKNRGTKHRAYVPSISKRSGEMSHCPPTDQRPCLYRGTCVWHGLQTT